MSKAGKKYDDGKAPIIRGFMNYFPRAIEAVALVSKYGADKYEVAYDEQNWRDVTDGPGRYADAEARHSIMAAIEGPWDAESAMLHAAHRAWNAMAVLEKYLESGVSLENPEPDLEKLAPHVRERYERK